MFAKTCDYRIFSFLSLGLTKEKSHPKVASD